MKKLLLVILSFFAINSFAQNISTGLNSAGTSEPIGGNDANWRFGTAINGTSIPKAINYYSGYWQPTPITGTGAQFIGNTGNYLAQKPGLYYFERTFTVASGVGLLTTNFSIAIDDELKSVELIDPAGASTDLTSKFIRSTTPSPYYLSKIIKNEVKCPTAGKWKIRILVNFIDTAAGLMVSGNVSTEGQCQQVFEDTKCCKGDKAQNLSTGFGNATNSLLPNTNNDDDWKITASPAGTPAAVITNPAVVSYAPASSKAQWIMPKGTTAPGNYTYERTIVVPPGFEAILTFSRIGADNEVELFVDSPSPGGSVSHYKSDFANNAFSPANVIMKNCVKVSKLAAGTHKIRAVVYNQSLYTGLLVEGCYEFVQVACNCPAGWLSNTSNIDGDITLDGQCKKMVCGPLNIKPAIKNQGFDGGFIWDNHIYVTGTKANGGAAICPPKAMSQATGIKGEALIKE